MIGRRHVQELTSFEAYSSMAYNNRSQGMTQVHGPAPVVYYAAPAIPVYQTVVVKNLWSHYDTNSSTGFGVAQILIAMMSFSAGIMALESDAGLCEVGIGIWASFIYLIGGSIACAAGADPKSNLIITSLVFSVFNILFGAAQVTVSSIGLAQDIYCHHCNDWNETAVAANSMMIVSGSLTIIFGAAMMAICCVAIDRASKVQPVNIPVNYAQHQPQPVFIQGPSAFQYQHQPEPPPHYVQQQYPRYQADKI